VAPCRDPGTIQLRRDIDLYLLAGADVAMTALSLPRRGSEHMRALVIGLNEWLDARNVVQDDIRGRMSR
jgi:hypothetical protein